VANSALARPNRRPDTPAVGLDDTLLALRNEAFALHGGGRLAEAIAVYERMLALKWDMPLIHNNRGHALAALGQFDAAMAAYRHAIALKPDYPEALCNWAAAHYCLDQLDEAEAKCRQAIAVNADCAAAHHNLALILKEKGRLREAQQAEKRAIRLAPRNTSYYEHLAGMRTFKPGDRYMKALQRLAADCSSMSAADQVHLHFALAKAFSDSGQSSRAFAQLLAGNKLKRQLTDYDEAATLARMERTREVFTPDFLTRHRGSGVPSRLPVFIIGMPRSGSTLIEQILASHPEVFGAGELTLLDQVTGAMCNALPGTPPFPAMASAMSAEHFRALGATYLDKLVQRAPNAARIVDKMPGNFLFAGLIHLALPDATIIHAVRDPIDTCVSCFSILFKKQDQTYDLAELGRYYRHYQALMAHWRRVLPPERFIELRYEDLVTDVEGAARRIVAHCGLTWDARCLDFHRTERAVRTASATQVRQPIYKSSIGRWREYEALLAPLLAELAPILSDACAA
jgi:tetratricopeptide (TPR) repeat protein